MSASGTARKLAATQTYMARSQRWKLPVTVTPISSAAVAGIEREGLTPK